MTQQPLNFICPEPDKFYPSDDIINLKPYNEAVGHQLL
jgi:hypothetical protein